jgi:hypothetical protein
MDLCAGNDVNNTRWDAAAIKDMFRYASILDLTTIHNCKACLQCAHMHST